ncbi:hypothetical protein EZS27_008190 [termite gut metagenome]|uniref:Uncharacterized protein n=1 Tax=termite gut metagenome TaxID=433724 RepID=A0A5J4SFL6_9ZZZZ
MKRYINRILSVATGFMFAVNAVPATNDFDADSVRLSLLTCAPGEEIYSLFGHTAIRYEYPKKHIDYVFNYGLFSFNTPNFIWRFVKGKTDYSLGVTEYRYFAMEYGYDNRAVWQQTLNLTSEEKERLAELLIENSRPENRIYRYNFLFDNCATRPRDKVEECLDGNIHYTNTGQKQTFRDIIYECTLNHKWSRFGIDFCLGSKADEPADDRQKMFAPRYLMAYFSSAVITDNKGNQRPLVSDTSTIVETKDVVSSTGGFPLSPMQTTFLWLMIIVSVTLFGLKKQRCFWGIDVVLFSISGLMGCIVAFLSFVSEHPAVSPNYLIVVFHPLHLLCLPFVIRREIKRQRSLYHLLNGIVLTLFIVLWAIIPQRINFAVLPLAVSLLVRSAANLMLSFMLRRKSI